MSDLPPPSPGQQPAWQPPAGPTPGSSAGSAPSPIRPYLRDPRAPKAEPVPPQPVVPPTHLLPPAAPAAPAAPAPPAPGMPSTPGIPGTGAEAQRLQPPVPTALPEIRSRSRLPAVIGAIVAVAVGAAAVLWVTRSDDESSDTRSAPADASQPTTPADAEAVGTSAPEPTPPSEAPSTSGAPVVLPTTAPSVAPTTPSETAVPTGSVLPAPAVPAGATLFSDPAGWTIAIDPAWEFQQSEQFTGWFVGTGTTGFRDNINVALETLASLISLDDYVVAAISFINTQATEVEIVDQRRLVGEDGIEVHVITWLGAVGGASQRLAFVQAMTVTSTRAYVATFTSQPGRLPELASVIGPYLATIRGT